MYDYPEVGLTQKATSLDFNRMGSLARAAMTAQTRQMLVPGLAFADFNFTFNGFQLTVSDGFLYKDGAQYRTLASTPINLVADTPPSDGLKRIVSIVAFAIPPRSDAPEQREFAVVVQPATSTAPATYQTEPRQTTTLNRQICSVARVLGDIAPQPTAPTVAADQCEIARVVLGRSGIERVDPVEDNRAPNLKAVTARLGNAEMFIAGQGVRLDTLDKNLAALAASTPTSTSEATIRQYGQNLAQLNELLRAKVGDLAYGTDVGLDLRYTDNTYAGYSATVQDGIRFPWVAAKETPLTLFTPGDVSAKVISNLLLPDFTEEPRLVVAGMDGSDTISSQVFISTTAVRTDVSRSVVRTGPPFTICNNVQFWQSGKYDAAQQIFTRDNGETFSAVATGVDFGAPVGYPPGTHIEYRLQKQWTDTWAESRWDKVTTSIPISGAIRGQTFRVPDFGYLTSIELPFTAKDATFGVTLMLCETTVGQPNIKRVLEKCDLTPADIIADAKGTKRTKFTFRPAYVDPGNLYAWVTVTKGNYSVATVSNNKYAQGTKFTSTDNGDFFQGDLLIDFAFTANFARFKSPRVELQLNPVDNINGDTISALKFIYGSVIPSGCKIIHMARRAGQSDWSLIAQVTKERTAPETIGASPFDTSPLPVSVQQKVVLIGTTTSMPAIDLAQAWVTALKLGPTLNHFTPPLALGTACNRAEVQVTVDGPFVPANHTNTCKLIVAGTTVNPTATSVAIDPDKPGKRTITYAFTFAAATSLRINIGGTLTSILSTYHVDNRFFRAWSA